MKMISKTIIFQNVYKRSIFIFMKNIKYKYYDYITSELPIYYKYTKKR